MLKFDPVCLTPTFKCKQEDDVMSEDHDLSVFRLLGKASSHIVSPPVIQRGNRVVKQDRGFIRSCAQLREERGDRKSPGFPFAGYPSETNTRCVLQNELMVQGPPATAYRLHLNLEVP